MSEQQYRGTLASGGAFVATAQRVEVFDPAGRSLAAFDRQAISGVSRDGQVLTLERHNDTIVTLTAASITDAAGLEQFIRDVYFAPPPPPEDPSSGPLAFDAFDAAPQPPQHEPEAEISAAPEPPSWSTEPQALDEVETTREPEPSPEPAPAEPEREAFIPPPAAPAAVPAAERPRGRRWWLWGCLGCGGLAVAALVCVGLALAIGLLDADDDDPVVIVVTNAPEPAGDDATATVASSGDEASPTESEDDVPDIPTQPPPGDVLGEGQSATVGGIEATYLGARADSGGFFAPDPGNTYVYLKFRLTNTTGESANVSTLLQFELTDTLGAPYNIALLADIEGRLDSIDFPAGATTEGEVAFETPEGVDMFIVTFKVAFPDEQAQWSVRLPGS